VTSGAPGESGRLLSLLAGHVDETLRARNKAGAPLSSLQIKLQYLRIIARLPSYGTRYFLVRSIAHTELISRLTLGSIACVHPVDNTHTHTHTHTHTFNGPLSGTTQVSWYQKCKTNLDFTEARDSEWEWHQLGRMQICTSLQTNNHASTPPLSFFTGRMPFVSPNRVKALKEHVCYNSMYLMSVYVKNCA